MRKKNLALIAFTTILGLGLCACKRETKIDEDDLFIEVSSDKASAALPSVSQNSESLVSSDTSVSEEETNAEKNEEANKTEENSEIDYDTLFEKSWDEMTEEEQKASIMAEYSHLDNLVTEEERNEEAIKYPIHVYSVPNYFDDHYESLEMDAIMKVAIWDCDYMHIVPFFHEYLGIDKDVYLCYYNAYECGENTGIWEARYYFTTDEERANRRMVMEEDVEAIGKYWGIVDIKYDAWECALYFRQSKAENDEHLTISDDLYVKY